MTRLAAPAYDAPLQKPALPASPALTLRIEYSISRLALVLIVALAVRLVAGEWWQRRLAPDEHFAFGDSHGYWVLGRALANGEPYQYGSPDARIMRMPGYPLLLAAAMKFAGDDSNPMIARRLNALLGTCAAGAVFCLGAIAFNRSTGLLAAAITAVYPGAAGMGVFVLSEAPFSPLLVLQMAATIKGWQASTPRAHYGWSATAGVLAGACILMRPSWLLFLPFLAICSGIGRGARRRILGVGIATLAAIAVLSPWWLRNYRVSGHFVPTTLTAGATLYDGWHDGATGGSDMQFLETIAANEHDQPTQGPNVPYEYRLNARLQREAVAWAKDHPWDVVALAVAKLKRFWSPWPVESPSSWPLRVVLASTFLPVLAAGAVAAWKLRSGGWICTACWLPLAYLSLLHVVFVGSMRYREPGMLPLFVLVAALIVGATPQSIGLGTAPRGDA